MVQADLVISSCGKWRLWRCGNIKTWCWWGSCWRMAVSSGILAYWSGPFHKSKYNSVPPRSKFSSSIAARLLTVDLWLMLWRKDGEKVDILWKYCFLPLVFLWYLQQLNTSPYVYRVQSKPTPVGFIFEKSTQHLAGWANRWRTWGSKMKGLTGEASVPSRKLTGNPPKKVGKIISKYALSGGYVNSLEGIGNGFWRSSWWVRITSREKGSWQLFWIDVKMGGLQPTNWMLGKHQNPPCLYFSVLLGKTYPTIPNLLIFWYFVWVGVA